MEENQLSDQEILERFRQEATKEEAFSLLMRKYQERLYWHIRKMVTFHEDADDALQNTFIKVWHALSGFRQQSQLYTWLYRIATNEALALIRQRKKKATARSLDDEEHPIHIRLAADPYFSGQEADRLLQEAIDTLPEKQRAVFTMRYYDAMKYEEIAAILETTTGGLKANYHHAAKKITDYLKAHLNPSA